MERQVRFSGILSSDPAQNPGNFSITYLFSASISFTHLILKLISTELVSFNLMSFAHALDFFSWNKVKIRYCDGASFAGHAESEFKVSLLEKLDLIRIK